jgi:hypothetical protein
MICAAVNAMTQRMRQEAVNEYTSEGLWSGLGAYVVITVMWLICALRRVYEALNRSLQFPRRATLHTPGRRMAGLTIALDKVAGSLNLVIVNRSRIDIWAEEAKVALSDLETDGKAPTPATHTILTIRRYVTPSETLRVNLADTVYKAAGRPRAMYSCLVSTVIRYRTDESDQQQFEQTLPSYRAKMISLVPISLRRLGWFDKTERPQATDDPPSLQHKQQGQPVRRSQRVATQSAVEVEGRFSDGSPFLDSTCALVLSAHGCLLTLAKPVRIGENLILRNVSTLQVQRCQVVFIGEKHDGRIQVGLGFESSAPEFWNIDALPSVGK